MNQRVLITGSEGLIGRVVRESLSEQGFVVKGFDIRGKGSEKGDVRDATSVADAMTSCDGVLHLAAVSRVVWGERDPELCWTTNVGGLMNVLNAGKKQNRLPWIIFASSREVYGQPVVLPATEDTPLMPMNVYARSKVEGERLVQLAREYGLRTSIVRLSNVFGRTSDHVDRVVPAFARAAVAGASLRVDGADHTFDFTHVEDVSRGIVSLIQRMVDGGEGLAPIHFVSGKATTLGELAALAIEFAKSQSTVISAPPRHFDVARFYGAPIRAKSALNWVPQVPLREGLSRLIADFEHEAYSPSNTLSAT
ncbi:UDP-N-acetylglucosamine 4-epimerase [Rhodoferax lithotrophicus]|uniref:UDP-N-acetylglucosamine 4-epimerase n=1 Tax=Rhodoferax lithotrophicus TaxID=2798804 RepID=A0ABN6DCT7_9BURK|nr:NAD(P)-dependent oxidoreductase [Rhodoferax sp. MIZ03]BCO29849.1 UDP-N-acetylglucosamine 4-epimerase [Rhodoferax sp. MIZ03]